MPDCVQCEQGFHRDELILTGHGDFVCDPCIDNHYGQSAEDDEYYLISELVRDAQSNEHVTQEQLENRHQYCEACCENVHQNNWDDTTDQYCSDCMQYYNNCYRCDTLTHEDDSINVYDDGVMRQVCSRCNDRHYQECSSCNDRFDELNYDDDEDCDGYCEECSGNRTINPIKEYSYKPNAVFKKSYSTEEELYLGVELEVEIDHSVANNDFLNSPCIYMKKDGSLNNGFEIISHPMTLSYHKKQFKWRDLLEGLISNDGKSHNTDTCGIHVHVSKNTIKAKEQWKLVEFMYKCRNNISILSRRKIFRYCEFKDTLAYGIVEHDRLLHDVIMNCKPRNRDRYAALNFQNANTIEFRIFRGTLKSNTFFACLEFSKASVEFVTKHGYSMFAIGDETYIWNNFCKFLSDSQKYNTLIKYLKSKQIFN